MTKMVGFGEFLLRLNPEGYRRFLQADRMEVNYTGAEANVCASLSMLGVQTEYVTRLPDNDIARAAEATLRKLGIGTRHIVHGGERIGVFYLEKGASQRPSKVVYDRKHTAIATASPEDFDWDRILDGVTHFHFTGITPALSENLQGICKDACRTAKEKGVHVSCDLNYRKKLWTEEAAKACMKQLMPYIDLLIANEEDAEKVLGIRASDTDILSGKLSREGYADVARQISETYGTGAVAITLRESISASENGWSGMLYTKNNAYFSRNYRIHLVDRVGGGDSFAAGLLFGILRGEDPQRVIEFAAAASCLKQTIELDYNLSTVEEIEQLVNGDESGRVVR